MNEPHHDKIELPEHDCLYESTNEQGYIDLEPAYRKSTVLRLLEADRKRGGVNSTHTLGEPVAWEYPSDEWVKAFFGEPDESGFYYFRGDFGNIAYRYQKAARATALQPAEPVSQHPDDAAVDAFAVAMKAKLAKKRTEGRGNWQMCTSTYLSRLLREHVEKGDPVDVANLAMMLHQNGQGITPTEPVRVPSVDEIMDAVMAYGSAHSNPQTTATERHARLNDVRALLASYGQHAQPAKSSLS